VSSPSPLNVHLEHYDGPLDLLLDLIRKQQIDIWNIPIASIASQYLEYVERARDLDIDLNAEFIYMAATLIHIKSRMLLPRDPEMDKDSADDDPRRELVDRLLEHEKFKNAAEMLQQKRMIEENVWSNPPLKAFLEGEDPVLAVTIFDLVKAFGEVIERARTRPVLEVSGPDVSVGDMILYLKKIFLTAGEDEPVFILQILERQRRVRAMIALFLAVLEMVKMQAVTVEQKDLFGEIALRRHPSFDSAFAGGVPVLAIEQEYS
jgi:segregation and condensation protein A